MKIHFHLPSIFRFKEPSTQDAKNVRNRHTQEDSSPPDLEPVNTNRHHHHSAKSLLKKLPKLLSRRKKSGIPAHASHETPAPSNRQDNQPEAVSIHQPTFHLGHPIWNEIEVAEKRVAKSIKDRFSQDALRTSEFKNMVQDCVNHNWDELDQKFSEALKNIPPGQSLEKNEKTREYAKERVIEAACDACYDLYADEMTRVEKEVVRTIRYALSGSGRDTPPELEKKMQFCIDYGLEALDKKFNQIMQNLPFEQLKSDIKGARKRVEERIIQSTREVRNVIRANVDEAGRIEKEVTGIIANSLLEIGKDNLTLPELKNRAQDCVNHGLHALDQKFDHIQQSLPPWQSRDKIERVREQTKERVLQSAHEACHALYAKEMDRIEKEIVRTIMHALGGSEPSELKSTAEDCITYGSDVLNQKFNDILQNLLPGQPRDKIEEAREQAKEHLIQSTRQACNAIRANADAMTRIEDEVVEIIANSLSKTGKDTLTISEWKNKAQDCINDGLHAFDQKIEQILKNLPPWQSRDKFERARGQAKERVMQSANVARIEKEVAVMIANSFPENGKDTFTISEFKNTVQDCINNGFHELDQTFDHILKNRLPGQSKEKLERTRKQTKERIIQSAHEACRNAGWVLPVKKGSNIKWEPSQGPLLIKRGLSLHQLTLNKANLASGAFGSVSIFKNENGEKFIGKTIHQGLDEYVLDIELKAYQVIYDAVGPHPNLVNAYGIAQVPNNRRMKRTMLMDNIPGPTGEKTFDALRKCWDTGKISSEQYWGAIQFIGRRLLDVTEHLGKAGVVHNDIKPENFLVNEKTGEPVLIDLGVWSKTGEEAEGGTQDFLSPEAKKVLFPEHNASQGANKSSVEPSVVDERSDVFTVGSSLLEGVEHLVEHFINLEDAGVVPKGMKLEDIDRDEKIRLPYKGLLQKPAFKDAEGNVVREPGIYSAETAYTRFMSAVMKENKDIRVKSDDAKKLDFLLDSMLDDKAAKEVIQKAISEAGKEEKKPKEEQWKPANQPMIAPEKRADHMMNSIDNFLVTPSLAAYATLYNESEINPQLKDYLNAEKSDYLRYGLEQEVKTNIERAIARSPWFDAVKRITESVKNISPEYENPVIQAKKDIELLHVNIEDLRKFAKRGEAFLRSATTLKKINNPEIASQLEQVKERVAVTRRMITIVDAELKDGNIRERANELEHQLGREQVKERAAAIRRTMTEIHDTEPKASGNGQQHKQEFEREKLERQLKRRR